jgi:hypothetical protein
LADAQGHEIVTIEGLSAEGSHPVQLAWEANNVPAMRLLPGRPDHAGPHCSKRRLLRRFAHAYWRVAY